MALAGDTQREQMVVTLRAADMRALYGAAFPVEPDTAAPVAPTECRTMSNRLLRPTPRLKKPEPRCEARLELAAAAAQAAAMGEAAAAAALAARSSSPTGSSH